MGRWLVGLRQHSANRLTEVSCSMAMIHLRYGFGTTLTRQARLNLVIVRMDEATITQELILDQRVLLVIPDFVQM